MTTFPPSAEERSKAFPNSNTMAETLNDLRRRIRYTGDLRSVVRTMKAMSAASITPFEEAVAAIADYRRNVELALSLCITEARATPPSRGLPAGHLIFGTDQGIVGQFNEDLANTLITKAGDAETPPVIWAVGERMRMRLENAGLTVTRAFPAPVSVEAITMLITDVLLEVQGAVNRGEVEAAFVTHNHPVRRGSREYHVAQLLPLDESWRQGIISTPWPTKPLPERLDGYPEDQVKLIHEHLFTTLFQACTESCAAEHAARLVAMQLAEKYIEERQEQLGIDYNHRRQMEIDEELFDLISGFEALSPGSYGKG